MASGFTLGELGDAAGRSLGSAQQALTQGIPQAPTQMAIAETVLELKVAVSGENQQSLRLHPVSPDQVRKGAIETAALSTVTLRFAAMSSGKGGGPTPEEVDKGKKDLLDSIRNENLGVLGTLEVRIRDATVIEAFDPAGRLIRSDVVKPERFKRDA